MVQLDLHQRKEKTFHSSLMKDLWMYFGSCIPIRSMRTPIGHIVLMLVPRTLDGRFGRALAIGVNTLVNCNGSRNEH